MQEEGERRLGLPDDWLNDAAKAFIPQSARLLLEEIFDDGA